MVFIFFIIGCVFGFVVACSAMTALIVGDLVIEEYGDGDQKWRLEFSKILGKVSKRRMIIFRVVHRENNVDLYRNLNSTKIKEDN